MYENSITIEIDKFLKIGIDSLRAKIIEDERKVLEKIKDKNNE